MGLKGLRRELEPSKKGNKGLLQVLDEVLCRDLLLVDYIITLNLQP